MRGQLQEDRVELIARCRLERAEELLFDAVRDRTRARELLLACGLEADEMAAAVGRIAAALDQARLLELERVRGRLVEVLER